MQEWTGEPWSACSWTRMQHSMQHSMQHMQHMLHDFRRRGGAEETAQYSEGIPRTPAGELCRPSLSPPPRVPRLDYAPHHHAAGVPGRSSAGGTPKEICSMMMSCEIWARVND